MLVVLRSPVPSLVKVTFTAELAVYVASWAGNTRAVGETQVLGALIAGTFAKIASLFPWVAA